MQLIRYAFLWLVIGCLLVVTSDHLYAQSPDCATATPFCDNVLSPFPAGTNQPDAPPGNNYDCLGTQPNPAWYTLTVGVPGNIDFTLDNTAGEDIDFILWGPFPSVQDAMAQCGGLGNGGASGGVVDCSYSFMAQEQVVIPNAQSGEVYVLLITNFSNLPTNIFSTNNIGTGTLTCDCGINNTYSLLPTPSFNQGIMYDTTGTEATFIVCGPDPVSGSTSSLGLMLSVGGQDSADSLTLYSPNTNIGVVFPGSALFVAPAATPPFYDSIDVIASLTPQVGQKGAIDMVLSVLNVGTQNACVQDFNITVIVPGVDVSASDTLLCALTADTVTLTSTTYMDAGFAGVEHFAWTQLAGTTVAFSDTAARNPDIHIPAHVPFGDVLTFVVDYSVTIDSVNGTICGGRDTISISVGGGVLTVGPNSTVCVGASSTVSAHYETFLMGGNGVCGINNIACSGSSNIVTIGTGVNPAPDPFISTTPFQQFYSQARMQMLFRASELTAMGIQPGLLTSLAFQIIQKNSTDVYPNFNINMGCTNLTQLTTFVSGLNNVYVNASYNSVLGWNTFNFQNTYEWDGTSNLIVEVCFTMPIFGFTDSDPVNFTVMPYQASIYDFEDTAPDGCALTGGFNFTTSNERPNVRWGTCQLAPPISYSWSPTATIPSGEETDSIATVMPFDTTHYIVVAGDGTCFLTDTVTVFTQSALPAPLLNCDSSSTDYISFVWNDLASAGFYEYSIDGGVNWVSLTDTSVAFSGLAQGDSINILVRGVSPVGVCPIGASSGQTCYTVICNFPAPVVNCTGLTTTSVLFQWDSIPQATAYEYSTNGGVTWLLVSDTSVLITGVVPNTTVNILVRGVNNTVCPVGLEGAAACATLPCLFPAPVITCGTATTTTVAFVWNTLTQATAYEYSLDSGLTWFPVMDTSVIITGATPNSLVDILVRGTDLAGACPIGATDTFACMTQPCVFPAPTISCGTATGTTAQFVWNDLVQASSYEYSLDSGLTWIAVTDTFVTITGAMPNSLVDILVRGTDTSACPVGEIDTFACMTQPCVFPAPVVTCGGSTTVSVSFIWNDLIQASSYEYSLDSGVTWIAITDTSILITGMIPNTLVDILVRGTDTSACPVGEIDTFACMTQPCVFPAPVVTCGGSTTSEVLFVWGGLSQASAYEYSLDSGLTWIPVTDTSVLITGIDPATDVDILVRGTDPGACPVGAIDTFVCATQPCVFPAPTVNCGLTTTSSVGFQWNSLSQATGYEYSLDGGNTWIALADTFVTVSGLDTGDVVNIQVRGVNTLTNCPVGAIGAGACTANNCAFQFSLLAFDNTACNNEQDNGYVVVNVSGGSSPFVFDLGGGVLDTIYTNTDTLLLGLQGGAADTIMGRELATNCLVMEDFTVADASIDVAVSIQQTAQVPCVGTSSAVLQANAISNGSVDYLWNTGDTTQTLNGLGAGAYTVVASVGTCTDTATYTVAAPTNPVVNAFIQVAGQDSTAILLGETVNLNAGNSQTGVSFLWSVNPSTPISNPSAVATTSTPDATGTFVYTVTATIDTCVVTDTVLLVVNPVSFDGLPTAFTPNGDGLNDKFAPVNVLGTEITVFKVFNRFGHLVYDNASLSDGGWDGTFGGQPQARDSYMYIFEFKRSTDTTTTMLRGEVMLVR